MQTSLRSADAASTAAAVLAKAEQRGWKQIIAKPVPSSWCLQVEKFGVNNLQKNLLPLQNYFDGSLVRNAQEVLVQEFVPGLRNHPETRAFFFGGEFLYAVSNSKAKPGYDLEVTEFCEASSDFNGHGKSR